MSDRSHKVWLYVVSVLVSIILALAGAWAHHVNNELKDVKEEIITLKIMTARIADRVGVEPHKP